MSTATTKRIGSRDYDLCPECKPTHRRWKKVTAPRCNHCAAVLRNKQRKVKA